MSINNLAGMLGTLLSQLTSGGTSANSGNYNTNSFSPFSFGGNSDSFSMNNSPWGGSEGFGGEGFNGGPWNNGNQYGNQFGNQGFYGGPSENQYGNGYFGGSNSMTNNSQLQTDRQTLNTALQADGTSIFAVRNQLQASGTTLTPQNFANQVISDTSSDSNAAQVKTDLTQLQNDKAASHLAPNDPTDTNALSSGLTTDGVNLSSLQSSIQSAIENVIVNAVGSNSNASSIKTDLSNIFASQTNQNSII